MDCVVVEVLDIVVVVRGGLSGETWCVGVGGCMGGEWGGQTWVGASA